MPRLGGRGPSVDGLVRSGERPDLKQPALRFKRNLGNYVRKPLNSRSDIGAARRRGAQPVKGAMMPEPDWIAMTTRVAQIIEGAASGRPAARLHRARSLPAPCCPRAADEAGEDRLIEFAASYGQLLDWIVLGDLDPTIRRLSAIGHDDGDPAVRLA